ncbi:MAG TPA: TonB-dependent receptor [Chitinophaga sp.]|uniref:TonB-dependent receptor n=1 Tax=Chitinophaga sp. TaxID=1869181 RepID=UPI002C38A5BC|nr:TonB-dependent receptor [Chitinophaga sp.]HVI49515.1 TonB-dependent receptor [Chitinophaga sp.]
MKKSLTFRERTTHALKKALLITRIVALLLLAGALQVSASVNGQGTITLKMKEAEISKVLSSIEKQGSYRFLYNNALKSIHNKINVDVANSGISELMGTVLAGTGLKYKVIENNLVVIMADVPGMQDIKITGKVTSAKDGTPVPGATISVKGTGRGTVTGADGSYTLTVPENATLVVTFIGFTSQEVAVNSQSVVNIKLNEAISQVEQVVVVGYGVQRKVDVTGAISQVKGDEISKQPAGNAVSSLQGKVAGVQIINNGKPGAAPQIKIRGTGTVYGSSNPLYVVDGVWYEDISFLNPSDIENMSILKDASSEAIYGIRAANGVVLITTRKGKAGKAVVNYNGYVGYQKVTNEVKMANAHEYAIMVNEIAAQDKKSPLLNPDNFGKGTDWYHQILRNAMITNHQISVSGGSEKSTYNFSLGYLKQDGLVKGNDFTRYTARLQNEFQVFEPLKIGYTVTATAYKANDIPDGTFRDLYSSSPVVPVRYADGSYGDPNDFSLGTGASKNPQATLDFYNQYTKRQMITGSVYADLRFAKHFVFHTSVGGEYGDSTIRNYTPAYKATFFQQNQISRLMRTSVERRNWIVENTLTYENRFKDHSLKVLLGQGAQQYQYYKLIASAPNVPNNSSGDMYLRLGSTDGREIKDEGDLYTIASYFGRINYSYKDRYLLTASLRADGSSKFRGGDLWGYFPSVGVGWVLSEEKFIKNLNFFDNLKLRGSWGRIGNASVPNSIAVLRVAQDPFMTAIFGGSVYTGASINSVVPPFLNWERGEGSDVGLETSIFKNRLFLEVGWYNRTTQSAIFLIPIPASVGTNSGTIQGNQANIRNRGWEISASWKDNVGEDFTYSIGGNIGINDNKVISVISGNTPIYGGGSASTGGALGTRTIVGQPVGQFFGYIVDGVFQTDAEAAASAQPTAKAGDFKYRDVSGAKGTPDGKIDYFDRVPLGNPNPKYSYGINTYMTYKNFDLSIDFQGVAGVDVYNANLGLRFGNENFTKGFYDKRWHGEGTSNTYPSAYIGGRDNYLPNSFFVEKGSYFRIRNIQLGYNLPKSLTDRWRMQKLRVYLNAQNAFNFFRYRGFTPEIGGPDQLSIGIDNNVYPLFATYNFGVNVTF